MPKAVPDISNAQVEEVYLSQLEEDRNLNPRRHLDHGAIQEYIRRLANGETPPPMLVHRASGVIIDGAHRYHAWKEFAGERWMEQRVPVIFVDDAPDPRAAPELFRLYAYQINRNHGVRIQRTDKPKIIQELLIKHGRETVEQYRTLLGETEESLEELVAALSPLVFAAEACKPRPAPQAGSATRTAQTDLAVQAAPAPKSAPAAVRSAVQSNAEDGPLPAAVRYRSEAFPSGHLTSARPPLRSACRRLQQLLRLFGGTLLDADREELLKLARLILDLIGVEYSIRQDGEARPARRRKGGQAAESRTA